MILTPPCQMLAGKGGRMRHATAGAMCNGQGTLNAELGPELVERCRGLATQVMHKLDGFLQQMSCQTGVQLGFCRTCQRWPYWLQRWQLHAYGVVAWCDPAVRGHG
jgi:hypothetical protein